MSAILNFEHTSKSFKYCKYDGMPSYKTPLNEDISQYAYGYLHHINKQELFYQTPIAVNRTGGKREEEMSISLDVQIAQKVHDFGYTIADIKDSFFEEMGEFFQVYTVELFEEISDYNELLQKEKTIRRDLGLYNKNIILELV